MNIKWFVTAMLCAALGGDVLAQGQDMDKELSTLAESLAARIKEHGTKKVTVLDFTDLEGSRNELGKYIAEQLTVDMVIGKREFSVLDRANLRSILAEHKLSAKGLVDPATAKQLGMFAGVDALVLGTVTPKSQSVTVTAKIITTETAEIVGAARAEFKADDTVRSLLSRTNNAQTSAYGDSDAPKPDEGIMSKNFGELHVEVESLRVLEVNEYFLLTLAFKNQSATKSISVALSEDGGYLNASLTDAAGNAFSSPIDFVTGMVSSARGGGVRLNAVEIEASKSLGVTIKFKSKVFHRYGSGIAKPGNCRLQLEFTTGDLSNDRFNSPTTHNLLLDIKAN